MGKIKGAHVVSSVFSYPGFPQTHFLLLAKLLALLSQPVWLALHRLFSHPGLQACPTRSLLPRVFQNSMSLFHSS